MNENQSTEEATTLTFDVVNNGELALASYVSETTGASYLFVAQRCYRYRDSHYHAQARRFVGELDGVREYGASFGTFDTLAEACAVLDNVRHLLP